MLDILIASGSRTAVEPEWRARAASFVIHALIVLAAVWATRQPARPPGDPILREDTVFFPVPPAHAGIVPDAPSVLPRLPGLQLPHVVPTELPPIDVPPGVFTAVLPGDPGAPPGWIGGDTGTVGVLVPAAPFDARYVEEAPVLLAHPAPRYPEILRQALLGGRVLVEAVVDTSGRVEPASLRITASPHALFGDEARAVVLGSRYRPARVSGRAVRVRIVVPVTFELRR
jgi:TonB family protein